MHRVKGSMDGEGQAPDGAQLRYRVEIDHCRQDHPNAQLVPGGVTCIVSVEYSDGSGFRKTVFADNEIDSVRLAWTFLLGLFGYTRGTQPGDH